MLLETGGDKALESELLERISLLLGIYRALHTLFPRGQQADSWLRRPNAGIPFQGRSALELMCSGCLRDIAAVREYLDGLGVDGA
ncbi:antitoxin Xre/MbcA/ParS toxin-binding domain-containing protein [Stenotrophomonas chelatiphaga]|uniref:antitoxin Xre/MbcA/ParS toxin-binding domain-containing protein n=1 Tax=Stenotrophomonas chelatiphaga TaxID=517011 RepID=UPI003CE59E2A